MARLGELLVAAGLLTADQVEQALRAQVMWGGRLGTNLIELGYLDLDALSAALGRQQRLPAALARHFDMSDPELQRKLSPDVAERYSAVPIRMSGPQQLVVFASCDAIDKRGLAIIARGLGVTPEQLVPSIAAELRIRYHLERVYKIPRGTRFLRSRGATVPPFPQFEIAPLTFDEISDVDIPLPEDPAPSPPSLAELIAEAVVEAPIDAESSAPIIELTVEPEPEPDDSEAYASLAFLEEPDPDEDQERAADDDLEVPSAVDDEPSGRERRHYVRTIDDEPSTDSERRALGRIAIRRVAVAGARAGSTLGEATRAIRRSTDRDRVADLVITTLDRFLPECDAAVLLIVRGELAIGWKGFCRSGQPLPEVGVPLDQPGLIPRAVQRVTTVRSPSTDLGPIDQLLLVSLGQTTGDVVVVPVTIVTQVMCLMVLVTEAGASIASAESIAAAAGAAFARLMRDASR